MAYCTKCGIALRAGADFCPQCRARVRKGVNQDHPIKKSPAQEKYHNQRNSKKGKQKRSDLPG